MSAKAFDFKKEFKGLYQPSGTPMLVEVPAIDFIMVDGVGDPNSAEFQNAVELLYGLTYTIKMSVKKGKEPKGYFEYVVPPLEGLWWIEGGAWSFEHRENWRWTAMIRQPEFVTPDTFTWASSELHKKKPELPVEGARLQTYHEGLCVQVMHIGPYATEPDSMLKISEFMAAKNLQDLVGPHGGKHHEIYLSDPRKSKPESMKTILRHPVRHGDGSLVAAR